MKLGAPVLPHHYHTLFDLAHMISYIFTNWHVLSSI